MLDMEDIIFLVLCVAVIPSCVVVVPVVVLWFLAFVL
jgi:hypothetical protein